MNTAAIMAEVENLTQPVWLRLGLELVDMQFQLEKKGWCLRFFIDKPGGIALDHCESASKEISHILDEHDPIPVTYFLEVSSPGLERPLKKKEDFERFCGHEVAIKTFAPIAQRKKFVGVLKDIYAETLTVITDDQKEYSIPLSQIAKANLVFRP